MITLLPYWLRLKGTTNAGSSLGCEGLNFKTVITLCDIGDQPYLAALDPNRKILEAGLERCR